jgi:hypothetical protein
LPAIAECQSAIQSLTHRHRGQARSHKDCGWPWGWRSLKIKIVGASLLAKAVGQPTFLLNVPVSSPASRLLQWVVGVREGQAYQKSTVGAGLPAMAVGQPTSLLNVPASSRASPLPQVLRSAAGLVLTEDQNCVWGLLAIADCHSTCVLNERMHRRNAARSARSCKYCIDTTPSSSAAHPSR